jgi:hypothetical protein
MLQFGAPQPGLARVAGSPEKILGLFGVAD